MGLSKEFYKEQLKCNKTISYLTTIGLIIMIGISIYAGAYGFIKYSFLSIGIGLMFIMIKGLNMQETKFFQRKLNSKIESKKVKE